MSAAPEVYLEHCQLWVDDADGSIVLTLQRDGQECPIDYIVTVAKGGYDLCRVDSGEVYSLRRDGGRWSCTCRDFQFRRRDPDATNCKHGAGMDEAMKKQSAP